jgi:hypothetical protein
MGQMVPGIAFHGAFEKFQGIFMMCLPDFQQTKRGITCREPRIESDGLIQGRRN